MMNEVLGSVEALGYEDYEPRLRYLWAGFMVISLTLTYVAMHPNRSYRAIPAVGGTSLLSSYLSSLHFFKHGNEMLQEGYNKYKPGTFRVPQLNRWLVVVTGVKQIDELRKASDDVLSFPEATKDIVASDYTLGPNSQSNPYHVGVVRGQLNRNLGTILPDIYDEAVRAFDDILPISENWTPIKAFDSIMKVVCRTSNRVFVGAPKCRDPEYVELNVQFTVCVVVASKIINLFPDFLKPFAGQLFSSVPGAIRTALKHLKPIIEERQRKIDEYGFNYPGKQNDGLSWLMDEARDEERSTRNLTLRVLTLNFASIHTTSMTFTQALFDLACHPECIPPLRQEVEAVSAKEGWNKAGLSRMRKLDSFLKESQRIHGLSAVAMPRVALKDFTFSDGTHIPKGGMVAAIATARQRDDDVYPHGAEFDPFRFSNTDEVGLDTNQMVTTSLDYLPFGHGRHACPGRFLVGVEMKIMMAHILLTYDIKMAIEQEPKLLWYGISGIPDNAIEVLFRRRRV